MEQKLFQDLTPESREETIKEMSISSENMVFQKLLDDAEIEFNYREFGNTAIRKAAVENELANIKQEFKDKMAPMKMKMDEHMKAIRNKAIEIEGEVFAIVDVEAKMTGYYDLDGNLISSRRALPDELGGMQVSSRQMNGTDY